MLAEFASWEEGQSSIAANKAPYPIPRASRETAEDTVKLEPPHRGQGTLTLGGGCSLSQPLMSRRTKRKTQEAMAAELWRLGHRSAQRGQGTRTLGDTDGEPQQEPSHALQGAQGTLTVPRTREHPLSVGHPASTASLCPCSGLAGVDRILPAAWEHPLAQAPCAFAGLLSSPGPPLCGADTGPRAPWSPLLILGGRFLPEKQELSGFRGGGP